MNKIPYYSKRLNGPYSYVNIHSSYTGHKKSNFKGKPKQNIFQTNNFYSENRIKNYFHNYTNNSFNSAFYNFDENQNDYHPVFHKNRGRYKHRPYFIEEKKIAEETNNDSVNEEEKVEEVLRIRVNVSDNQCKELVLCKNDDIRETIVEFCKVNNIGDKLVEPLINKVNQSLSTLEIINNSMLLNKNDYLILDKIKNISDGIENNSE